jgi:hypothetical protein
VAGALAGAYLATSSHHSLFLALSNHHRNTHHNHIIAIMKGTTFLATAIAAGTASAGVHKMPLKKVPLSKQLVSYTA